MLRLSELKIKLDSVSSPPGPTEALSHDAQKIGTEGWLESTLAQDNGPRIDLHRQAPQALRELVLKTLHLEDAALKDLVVHKRSFDARGAGLTVVYIVDLALDSAKAETALLAHWRRPGATLAGPRLSLTPDMAWHPKVGVEGEIPKAQESWDPQERMKHLRAASLSLPFVKSGLPRSCTAASTQVHRPVVVGFGPCGIFAALVLAQLGLQPIVIERGKAVRERTKDTWGFWRKGHFNPQSHAQFGEGGAGTFSDGKLYSQIKDPRFLGRQVMQEFVKAGAPEEILMVAHPHIGTFKLVKVVENLREQIVALGGEIRFEQCVESLELDRLTHAQDTHSAQVAQVAPIAKGPHGQSGPLRQVQGLKILDLKTQQTYTLESENVVLALGHSARDTFVHLYQQGVAMKAKPFSLGFRIEHPQSLIDLARWGRHAGHPLLGAADYKLVHHAKNGRDVYSFCMCPGGTVVAAASEPHQVVTNGMSQYSRAERNANAAIVVGITPEDFDVGAEAFVQSLSPQALSVNSNAAQSLTAGWDAHQGVHPLSGLVMQRALESRAYAMGGENYHAPAQLVGDFLKGRASQTLGGVEPSYKPGVLLTDLNTALPTDLIQALREALPAFGQTIQGFDRDDAVLTGVETRTSSPLRMERDEGLQSLNTRGLYPAGEGAGFAGGILSAAVDGIKVAEAMAQNILRSTGLHAGVSKL